MIPETENPQEAKSVCRISLCDMLRLIRVDTLRRFHNVGFLVGRLICCLSWYSMYLLSYQNMMLSDWSVIKTEDVVLK